jgi:hypothetical protein
MLACIHVQDMQRRKDHPIPHPHTHPWPALPFWCVYINPRVVVLAAIRTLNHESLEPQSSPSGCRLSESEYVGVPGDS